MRLLRHRQPQPGLQRHLQVQLHLHLHLHLRLQVHQRQHRIMFLQFLLELPTMLQIIIHGADTILRLAVQPILPMTSMPAMGRLPIPVGNIPVDNILARRVVQAQAQVLWGILRRHMLLKHRQILWPNHLRAIKGLRSGTTISQWMQPGPELWRDLLPRGRKTPIRMIHRKTTILLRMLNQRIIQRMSDISSPLHEHIMEGDERSGGKEWNS